MYVEWLSALSLVIHYPKKYALHNPGWLSLVIRKRSEAVSLNHLLRSLRALRERLEARPGSDSFILTGSGLCWAAWAWLTSDLHNFVLLRAVSSLAGFPSNMKV